MTSLAKRQLMQPTLVWLEPESTATNVLLSELLECRAKRLSRWSWLSKAISHRSLAFVGCAGDRLAG